MQFNPACDKNYSHSIVAGGLLDISYTTLPIPSTEFVIREDISRRSLTTKG